MKKRNASDHSIFGEHPEFGAGDGKEGAGLLVSESFGWGDIHIDRHPISGVHPGFTPEFEVIDHSNPSPARLIQKTTGPTASRGKMS
ncbi:MAG: hypothetical protein OSB05_16575, partial [Akkermansiaceae bacterium]|nr:hypothetical protein [Akkermansiaceae bacterium]